VEPTVASTLRIAVMRLSRRMRAERNPGRSASELAALASLERRGPMSLTDLSSSEKVTPPSMTRVVSTLSHERLVTRTPHPTDGRQILIEITAKGRALLAADRQRRDEWLLQRLEDLSEPELETLRQAAVLLDRLADS
jgi:DNA-binding MarR family transcriptional regulator